MKRLLVFLALALLSIGVASASLIPCTISGTAFSAAVSNATVVTCGTLTFDNFQVLNATPGAGPVEVLAGSTFNTSTGTANVQFDPLLSGTADEELLFQVWGGISQIDMSVGGSNATVMERACANPIATTGALAFLCTNPAGTTNVAPLGQITVASGTTGQPVFSPQFAITSPVYIFKNINTSTVGNVPGQLTEFTQSFETVPEPVTMGLLGSGLLGLGLLRRRSRKN